MNDNTAPEAVQMVLERIVSDGLDPVEAIECIEEIIGRLEDVLDRALGGTSLG